MDDTDRAAEFRTRARAIRDQGRRLKARAEAMPPGRMRDMLATQADILAEGANKLEARALELTPPVGTA
jgi:hypothetical protein